MHIEMSTIPKFFGMIQTMQNSEFSGFLQFRVDFCTIFELLRNGFKNSAKTYPGMQEAILKILQQFFAGRRGLACCCFGEPSSRDCRNLSEHF